VISRSENGLVSNSATTPQHCLRKGMGPDHRKNKNSRKMCSDVGTSLLSYCMRGEPQTPQNQPSAQAKYRKGDASRPIRRQPQHPNSTFSYYLSFYSVARQSNTHPQNLLSTRPMTQSPPRWPRRSSSCRQSRDRGPVPANVDPIV